MTLPWIIDFASRFLGVDIHGWEGFYIPYFYAMSDQMGANIFGFLYIKKKEGSTKKAIGAYFKNPVMMTSLIVILTVPIGLLIVRLLGFSPDRNLLVAIETVAANLCWLPPLVGMLYERKP